MTAPKIIKETFTLSQVDKPSWFITPKETPRMYQPYFIRMNDGSLWPEVFNPGTDKTELKRKIDLGIIYTFEKYKWKGEAWRQEYQIIQSFKQK